MWWCKQLRTYWWLISYGLICKLMMSSKMKWGYKGINMWINFRVRHALLWSISWHRQCRRSLPFLLDWRYKAVDNISLLCYKCWWFLNLWKYCGPPNWEGVLGTKCQLVLTYSCVCGCVWELCTKILEVLKSLQESTVFCVPSLQYTWHGFVGPIVGIWFTSLDATDIQHGNTASSFDWWLPGKTREEAR